MEDSPPRELDSSGAAEAVLAAKRIAMVGASPDPSRPSHGVMRYLLEAGYEVIPVRPGCEEVLGRRCYAALAEVEPPVDLVNVFRKASAAPEVATQAAEIGARTLWLQTGIRSAEAARIAAEAGMAFVQDRCIRTVLQSARRRETL